MLFVSKFNSILSCFAQTLCGPVKLSQTKHLKIFFIVGRKVKRSKSFKLFASQELLIGAILRKHFLKLENANLATYLKIADFIWTRIFICSVLNIFYPW